MMRAPRWVWAWWPQGDDRAIDTPVTIISGHDSFTVNVDQRNNGNEWYLLGTFPSEAEETVMVVVAGTESGFANADAVALTPVGAGPPAD